MSLDLIAAAWNALAIDPLARGLQIANADKLARQHFPHLDPDLPALVVQVHSRAIARACKRALMILYPREHIVTRIDAAGTTRQKIERLPLARLDRANDHNVQTTWYIPPLPRPSSMNALGQVVAHLRAPDGCPWDRAQTHQSLRKDFLEECYEVLETLDQNDVPHLREELGDLLLHIFLQTQIAAEAGEFRLTDVVADITAKLVRRHPHVFGDVRVNGTDEIVANWEQIKQSENGGKKKRLAIPRALPALASAQRIAKRKKSPASVQAIAAAVQKLSRVRNREKALGELLFLVAAYAAAQRIDAEGALRRVARQQAG